jgi:hypothetical protein
VEQFGIKILNKKEVIKHSSAIQISNKVNLLQRRAWNVLLANAFDDLEAVDQFSIPLKELRGVLRYRSHNDEYLKQLLRALMHITVEWNILRKDGNNEWGIAVLLADAQIINGVLHYGYAPTMRRRLHNPSMYAKISLSLQNKFDSKHSLALYELFLDYFNLKTGNGETPWILVEDFRKLLGLKENEYKEFKDLNKHIIKKAFKEINDKSDLFVISEYQRRGRRVIAVKFLIEKNPKNMIDIRSLENKSKIEQTFIPEQNILPELDFEIDNDKLFHVLMNEFFISKNKAVEILKTRDEFYIQEILETVRKLIEDDKVKDIPAFTISAIEKDYRCKKNNKTKEDTVKIRKKKDIEKIFNDINDQVNSQRNNQAEIKRKKLTDEELNHIKHNFAKEVEKGKFGEYVKENFRKKGLNGSGVRMQFSLFIADKILPPIKDELKACAKSKGYDYQKLSKEFEVLKKNKC